MIIQLIDEAVRAGARREKATALLGLSSRAVARWRIESNTDDRRRGPATGAQHRLTDKERERVLTTANLPEYRNLSPRQIVPLLADRGQYIASESTFYRVLREAGQLAHRQHARPARRHRPKEHVARGPNEVWSWDITYLRGPVRGSFFYLYLIVDVWSRKIVGCDLRHEESAEHARSLVEQAIAAEEVDPGKLVLHADNGGPMKGSTLLATLQRLDVVPSFSRPSVSDDNPFSEALFRTMKYPPIIRESLSRASSRRCSGSRASCAGTTPSICTAASATSRLLTAIRVKSDPSSPIATRSTRRLSDALRAAGRAPLATGRPSAPCT
jgi:putative transposase